MHLRNCFLLYIFCITYTFLRTWYAIIHWLVFAHEIVPSFHSDVLLSIRVVLIKYFWWIISVTFCALRCRHETNKKFILIYFRKMQFFTLHIHPSIHPCCSFSIRYENAKQSNFWMYASFLLHSDYIYFYVHIIYFRKIGYFIVMQACKKFFLLCICSRFFAIKFNLKATIFSYFQCYFLEEFDADCPWFVL